MNGISCVFCPSEAPSGTSKFPYTDTLQRQMSENASLEIEVPT